MVTRTRPCVCAVLHSTARSRLERHRICAKRHRRAALSLYTLLYEVHYCVDRRRAVRSCHLHRRRTPPETCRSPPGSRLGQRALAGRVSGGCVAPVALTLCSFEQRLVARAPTIGATMIQRPAAINAFEFVVMSSLRAAQLMRGCTPRVTSTHKTIMTAQLEVAAGKVARLVPSPPGL